MLQEEVCRKDPQEELKWKHRINWLEEGYRNIKFFHGIVSVHKRFYQITTIMARCQVWDKKPDIEREVVKRSFTQECSGPELNWME